MGRRKIEIKYIEDDRQRKITYAKRSQGVMKKAHELATLCGCEVGLFVMRPEGIKAYSSKELGLFLMEMREQMQGGTPIDSKTCADFEPATPQYEHFILPMHQETEIPTRLEESNDFFSLEYAHVLSSLSYFQEEK